MPTDLQERYHSPNANQPQRLELKSNIAHYMEAGGKLASQNTRDFNHYMDSVYAPGL